MTWLRKSDADVGCNAGETPAGRRGPALCSLRPSVRIRYAVSLRVPCFKRTLATGANKRGDEGKLKAGLGAGEPCPHESERLTTGSWGAGSDESQD